MASMRVFELAKELKMPARQLLQRLRIAGIPASGNFQELTGEQVNRVHGLISGKTSSVDEIKVKTQGDRTRRVISSRKDPEVVEETEELEPKVITISAKSQQEVEEEEDNRPRLRRRRRLEALEKESEETTFDINEETSSKLPTAPEPVEAVLPEAKTTTALTLEKIDTPSPEEKSDDTPSVFPQMEKQKQKLVQRTNLMRSQHAKSLLC